MKIMADKEGKQRIEQLCDVALKAGGLQNRLGINRVMDCIELIKEKPKKDKGK